MALKIGSVSDLHLEFRRDDKSYQQLAAIINSLPVDVVVNAGDTHPQPEMRGYFKSLIHKPYYEILGNHDFYHQQVLTESRFMFDMNDVKVCGATLWTDFRKHDPLIMMDYAHTLVDARQIAKPAKMTLAEAAYQIHVDDLHFIEWHKPDVVVTHHGPSLQVVHPMFRQAKMFGQWGPNLTNYYFCSDLDEFILRNQNIKLWIFGHTHRDMDVMVGSTRVVSRQLGYPGETIKSDHNYNPLIVEVPDGP